MAAIDGRPKVRFEWMQVPDEMRRVRSLTLAQLLTAATGRKVSQGDALLLVCNLWAWVIDQVREDSEDLGAEFQRVSVLPTAKADVLWPTALNWPARQMPALITALSDRHVQVVAEDGDMVRVLDVEERYMRLAKKQGDSRGRARAAYHAKEHGWKHEAGKGYVSPTGEVIESWRDLLARFEKEKA